MRILILDVYPKKPYRITKDMNGGFGTANDLGQGLIPRILSSILARSVDWPPLHCMSAAGVLKKSGHEVVYSRESADLNYDLVIVPSSIVAHETEIEAVKKVVSSGVPCFVIGPFATAQPAAYIDSGACVISGEPEMFFYNFNLLKMTNKILK